MGQAGQGPDLLAAQLLIVRVGFGPGELSWSLGLSVKLTGRDRGWVRRNRLLDLPGSQVRGPSEGRS